MPDFKLATILSSAIFESHAPKTIVVGPDAYAMDPGDDGLDLDDRETIYDKLVDELVGPSDNGEPAHRNYDLFLASEMWIERRKMHANDPDYDDEPDEIGDKHTEFFNQNRNLALPLIDDIAALPFRYYINFGFDEYLSRRVKRMRPRARIFNVVVDELRGRWKATDEATDDSPWVINMLGRPGESTSTYGDLARLFSEVLQDTFLSMRMKEDISTGRLLYVGMQLRHWYTRILLLSLGGGTAQKSGSRRAFELREPAVSADRRCIELYSQGTSNITTKIFGYKRIRRTLDKLMNDHKVTTVFISYRHAEAPRMREIKQLLTDRGQIVVNTSEDFSESVGEEWQDLRNHAIRSSDYYLQLITESMRDDRRSDCWVELEKAIETHKDDDNIIPVLYDDLEVDKVTPELSARQAIRFDSTQWQERLVDRIAKSSASTQ